jgi:hypothetical protein
VGTLGAALVRAGHLVEAVKYLKEAIAAQYHPRGVAGDRLFLAMAYWHLGKKERARATLQPAVEWLDANQTEEPAYERLRAEAEALIQEEED